MGFICSSYLDKALLTAVYTKTDPISMCQYAASLKRIPSKFLKYASRHRATSIASSSHRKSVGGRKPLLPQYFGEWTGKFNFGYHMRTRSSFIVIIEMKF